MKIAVFIVGLCVFMALVYFYSFSNFNWGHHFTFENQLNIPIDSLEISVGGLKTMIYSDSNIDDVEGNIHVPKRGYPHEVLITIYSDSKKTKIIADSFNCYNCDGSHIYTLNNSRAKYKFEN